VIAALIPILGPLLGQVVKSVFPNADDELKRLELQNQIQLALINNSAALETAAASIVKAEAESENWLTSSWRPILMLVFGSLIVARWFGFTAPGITEAVELKLWGILEVGIGGYVIGRSAEKIAPQIASALKK
jgi:hypothetical protein